MRLAYFGTGSFALPTLAAMKNHISLVVTQPDRPTGRGMKLQPNEVKKLALDLGIPVLTPEKARAADFVQAIADEEFDALLVASYGQILSEKVLQSAKRGGINLHGSILPAGRGAAPIQRSVMVGDSETGVTLMQMDRGMDTGDIIHIEPTAIGLDETYGELQDRLALIAADFAVDWMPRIVAGDYTRIPQPEDGVTIAPKISPEETALSTERDATEEYNRFRGLYPSYRPFLPTGAGRLRLLEVRKSASSNAEPGTIVAVKPLTVAFRDGALEFLTVQPEGKKPMSGSDFANGARLRPGMRFDQ